MNALTTEQETGQNGGKEKRRESVQHKGKNVTKQKFMLRMHSLVIISEQDTGTCRERKSNEDPKWAADTKQMYLVSLICFLYKQVR